jgi:hypothetical protein
MNAEAIILSRTLTRIVYNASLVNTTPIARQTASTLVATYFSHPHDYCVHSIIENLINEYGFAYGDFWDIDGVLRHSLLKEDDDCFRLILKCAEKSGEFADDLVHMGIRYFKSSFSDTNEVFWRTLARLACLCHYVPEEEKSRNMIYDIGMILTDNADREPQILKASEPIPVLDQLLVYAVQYDLIDETWIGCLFLKIAEIRYIANDSVERFVKYYVSAIGIDDLYDQCESLRQDLTLVDPDSFAEAVEFLVNLFELKSDFRRKFIETQAVSNHVLDHWPDHLMGLRKFFVP